ncbi:MAG: molybdopterin molybdotransferase MoeA [Promethearchaeota archaeon]
MTGNERKGEKAGALGKHGKLGKLNRYGFQELTPVQSAIDQFFPMFGTLPAETVDMALSLGRIVAREVTAPNPIPPFPRSAMDGYAIRAEDTFGVTPSKPKKLRLVGKIPIGEYSDVALQPGQAVEIATGAPVPEGADAVIKVEDTREDGEFVEVFSALAPGKNVAPVGEDTPEGRVIAHAGCQLTPAHVGLLCAAGVDRVLVSRRPRVALIGTGDELLPPGVPLEPGKIHESNNAMNRALLSFYGAEVVEQEHLPDDLDEIKAAIVDGTGKADMVVCSGGTSVGTKDFLPRAVAEVGEVVVHGLGQRPGTPVLLGKVRGKPVVCLPGFPVANFIGVLKIAGPLVRYLQGATVLDPRKVAFGVVSRDVPVKGFGQVNHLRVKLEVTPKGYVVHPVKLAGSGVLRSITESDGFVEIPPESEGVEAGEVVKVYYHPFH